MRLNQGLLAVALATTTLAFAACSSTPQGSGDGSGGAFGTGGFMSTGGVVGMGGVVGTGGDTFSTGTGGDILGPIEETDGGTHDCAKANFQGDLLPSNILFLVDRSGSMNCNLPDVTSSADCETTPKTADTTKPTKWSVISGAISTALDQLATVPNTSVGLTFFSNDDTCGVTSTPNVGLAELTPPQVSALKNALTNANPKGGTPFIGATVLGFKHLHQQAQAPGNRFVILVTDGQDSCGSYYEQAGITGAEDRLLNTELPKARSVNIRTFVIGAPGSEPARKLLSEIAFAGGTARAEDCDHASDDPAPGAGCHFDMTTSTDFAADLTAALNAITGQAALKCEFDVPQNGKDGKPLDKTSLNVDYYKNGTDKAELFHDQQCTSGADGWKFSDETTQSQIVLCDALCDQIHKDLKAKISVVVGCTPRVR